MTRTEVQNVMIRITNELNRNIKIYKDFLDIQEGLIGEKSPLITKFRTVINNFETNTNRVIKAASGDLQKLYPIIKDYETHYS